MQRATLPASSPTADARPHPNSALRRGSRCRTIPTGSASGPLTQISSSNALRRPNSFRVRLLETFFACPRVLCAVLSHTQVLVFNQPTENEWSTKSVV